MNRFSLILFDLIKKQNSLCYLKEFERTKYFSKDELRAYQLVKVKKILAHAELYSPFYKERLKEVGINSHNLTDLSELSKIPPLTRSDLQNHWKDIVFAGRFG